MSSRKADFLRFGAFGFATFCLVFWIQVSWLRIVAWLMGRDSIIFSQQPEWSRVLASAVGAIPWLIGGVLVVVAILRRRWVPLLAFVGSYILGIALFLFVLFGTPVVQDYASRTSFDSARWKAENRRGAEGIRVRMVDDLLRRHRLVGMSCAQLEDLLGVPPPSDFFRDYDYVYWLGPERGAFSIDSEWLVVRCGQAGVASAEVVTD
jgi:hypothetical protein